MVMSLIAVLASIVLVVGRGISERSKVSQARAELAVLAAALEQYKQQYGDYPWTPGNSATPKKEDEGGEALDEGTNESKLFNALMGVFGPKLTKIRDSGGNETLGRVFVEGSRFSFESIDSSGAVVRPEVGTSSSGDPEVTEVANALLDPWGRRYQYGYRASGSPTVWTSAGFKLFSAGPNGTRDSSIAAEGFATIPQGSDDVWDGR